MHLCLRNVWKVKEAAEIDVMKPRSSASWMHRHDTCWVCRQREYRSYNAPKNRHARTQPLWCRKCSVFQDSLCSYEMSFFHFTDRHGLTLLHLPQAEAHRVVWSPHPSVWRAMEAPVSQRVLSQLDLSLSPTLMTRTHWSKWQNTSLLGLARPCVPTATWSSGEGINTVERKVFHDLR